VKHTKLLLLLAAHAGSEGTGRALGLEVVAGQNLKPSEKIKSKRRPRPFYGVGGDS